MKAHWRENIFNQSKLMSEKHFYSKYIGEQNIFNESTLECKTFLRKVHWIAKHF